MLCPGNVSNYLGWKTDREDKHLTLTVLEDTGVIYDCGSSGIDASLLHSPLLLRLSGERKELERQWQGDPLTHLTTSSPSPPASPEQTIGLQSSHDTAPTFTES